MNPTYEDNSFKAQVDIWGDKVLMSVSVENLQDDTETAALKISKIMETAAELINKNRRAICKALLDEDMIESAEEWASSCFSEENYDEEDDDEEDSSEEECYILPDGNTVTLPISEEDFLSSLHIESVLIYAEPKDGKYDYPDAEIFIVCDPDYFLGHCIDVIIKKDGSVEVYGLAG